MVTPKLIMLPMWAQAISGDGKSIVGINKDWEGIVRQSDGTIRKLMLPPGSKSVEPTSISDDGRTIVGFSRNEGQDGYQICLWRGESKPIIIGSSDAIFRHPFISGDGTTPFYMKFQSLEKTGSNTSSYQTCMWTQSGGVSILPNIVTAISKDAKVQVGYEPHHNYEPPIPKTLIEGFIGKSMRDDTDTVAMKWENGKEPTKIGIPTGSWASYSYACNHDGSLVGGAYRTEHGHRPFLWSKEKGFRILKVDDGKLSLNGWNISSDGRYFFTSEETASTSIALVWIDEVGPVRLIDEAMRRGLPPDSRRPLKTVTGVSSDGHAIIGFNSNEWSWLLTW